MTSLTRIPSIFLNPHPSRHRVTTLICVALLFLVVSPARPEATLLTGTPLNDGYHDMYNLAFAPAHGKFQDWMSAHPEDPLGPASDAAAYLFSEFDRLGVLDIELFADDKRFENRTRPATNPATEKSFYDRAAQADRLADACLQRNPKDTNALYSKTLVAGMRADWASLIDRHEYAAYKLSEQASKYARQALAVDPTLYDANLAPGVESYMLSLKAAPVRWILGMTGAPTNKAEGVRLLQLTAERGHYLAPFARLMLAVGELRDGHKQRGKEILQELSSQFPQNTLYARQIARLN